MQRAFYALVALLTVFASAAVPTRAQSGADKTTVRPGKQQAIESPADPLDEVQAPTVESNVTVTATDAPNAMVIRADQTVDNVVVRDRALIIEGHVRHDVMAVNSDVTIKHGATVGNVIDAIGGKVDNRAGGSVHIVHQDAGVVTLLDGILEMPAVQTVHDTAPRQREGSWSGGQFALLLLGLLTGLAMHLMTPRAARQTSDVVGSDRGRSLAYGLIAAVLMIPGLLLGAQILRSPFGLFLSPFVAAFALVCAVLLAYGWICGMAEVGYLVQRLLGVRQGAWFSQIAFGLTGFFVLNLICGSVWRLLGVGGLTLEAGVALMGLGAALISGFGTDPNWLSARLKGEIPWLARTPRI